MDNKKEKGYVYLSMKTITKFIKSHILYFIGLAVGAIGGYIYYATVGCLSGTCPITSSPTISVIWGAALGALILGMFEKKSKL